MLFGDGLASLCAEVEEKYGAFAAWVTFFGLIGSAIGIGLLTTWLSCAHAEWTVGRKYPNQTPCNQPHVCDTFHGFLVYEAQDFFRGTP
jgi:hypothetical protein